MAPTCTHERDVRRCPWCREEHSLHLGYPIEVAQLAHRRRWDDDPHTVASLSADARRAYAKAAGRVPREVECGECRGTGIDERASVQVGGPYMDDGSGAVPCGSCGGAGRWVEPRRVTAGDVVTLEAAIASAVDRCPECGEFLFIYGAGGVWIDPRHFAQDAELASPAEVEALRLARERADAGEEQVGPVAWGFGVYPYRCECGTFPDPPNWHDNCGGVPF